MHRRMSALATVEPAAAARIVEAMRCLESDALETRAEADGHFAAAFAASPDLAEAFAAEFAEAADARSRWRGRGAAGEEEWAAVCASYLRSAAAAPGNARVLVNLGVAAHDRGRLVEARAAFGRAAALDDALGRECASRTAAAIVENWHWRMVGDGARNAFFAGAVADAVAARPPGAARVLDVGAGTGLLSLAAARAGAARVDAVERCPAMARVAEKTVAAHGAGDVVRVHCSASADFAAGERYDVVVAEVVDAAVFGEGFLATVGDATRRLGAPTCDVVPRFATLRALGVESAELRRSYAAPGGAFAREPYTVADLDAVEHDALVEWTLPEWDLVAAATYATAAVPRRAVPLGAARGVVVEAGTLHAIAAWFVLRSGSSRLSTGPAAHDDGACPRATSWTQALFHVEAAPPLARGAVVELRAAAAPRDDLVDVLVLEYRVDGGPWAPCAPPPDPRGPAPPSGDDVARLNDAAFAAAHGRAVAEAAAARGGAPVAHFGVFGSAGGARGDGGGRVVVSHCPVEAGGLLRPGAFDLPRARAAAVVPLAAAAVGKLVSSPALARCYFAADALGFDVSALDAFASPRARDVDPRAFPDLADVSRPFELRRLDFSSDGGEARAADAATATVVAAAAGVAHALLFWWRLDYGGGRLLSTRPDLDDGGAPSSHWRCAAVVLNRTAGIPVAAGSTVAVTLAVRYEALDVLKVAVAPPAAAG